MTVMFVAPEPEPVHIEKLLTAGLEGPDAVRAELATLSDSDMRALIGQAETSARQVGALQVAVLDEIEHRGLHREDGQPSAKVMVRHIGRLSAGEAAGREKARRMLRRLEAVAEAYATGTIGTEQVRLLGRIHANRRVAAQMADHQGWFLEQAQTLEYVEFEQVVRQWERLMDQDGAHRAAERAQRNRDFQMVQDHFSLGWEFRGGFGSLDGAANYEIFEHYLQAELLADWEAARALHGDDATADDLPRTGAQRRADAMSRIFSDAASTPAGANAPRFTHDIKWDHKSFEKMLKGLDDQNRQPLDLDSVCETINGIPIAPTEAILNALVHHFSRVIVDSAGTVIDLGVARRFTGSARLAAQLAATRCRWSGCLVHTSRCQIDHTTAHREGGSTNPDNGEPLCGWHNREKERGFTVWRDPDGQWHTYRPDGTEIA